MEGVSEWTALRRIYFAGYDDDEHEVHEENGQDAYAQGVGSQASGFSNPLQFDSDVVVSDTQYSQPQPVFLSPTASMSGFHAIGGYYSSVANDAYSGHQTYVEQCGAHEGLNLNSHYFFK